MNYKLAFLCGARDFHAMDWYRNAKLLHPDKNTCDKPRLLLLTSVQGGRQLLLCSSPSQVKTGNSWSISDIVSQAAIGLDTVTDYDVCIVKTAAHFNATKPIQVTGQ